MKSRGSCCSTSPAACNKTAEEFSSSTEFLFDGGDQPHLLTGWWANPPLKWLPTPNVIEASNGVKFLISGRPRMTGGKAHNNLVALASWQPYPVPAGVVIPVGVKCERLWLLLQSYVHPMKNYLPNGEVILVTGMDRPR